MSGFNTRPRPVDYEDQPPGAFHQAHQDAGYHRDGRCHICYPTEEEVQAELRPMSPNDYPVLSPEASNEGIRVQDLWSLVCEVVDDSNSKYPVVTVINPGDGPDEQLIEIKAITWDHDLQVLRLEQ